MEGHRHHRRSRVLRRDAHAHIHDHAKREIVTQVDIVYVTASNTAGGKVTGYQTQDDDDSTSTTVQVKTSSTSQAKTTTTAQAKTTTTAQAKPTTTSQARTTATSQVKSTTTTTPKTTATPEPETTTQPTTTTTQPTTQPTSDATSETTSETVEAASATEEARTTASSSAGDETPIATTESSTSSQTTFSTRASSMKSISSTVALESATGTIASATSTSTAAPASSGMSTTATVGLIAGAAAILVVVGAFALFFYRRRSQKKAAAAYGKTEDEKRGAVGGRGHGIDYNEKADDVPLATSDRAPRVSLRPVTQFLPNLMTSPAANTAQQATGTSPTGLAASAASDTRKAPPPALNLVRSDNIASSPTTGSFTTAPLVAPSIVSPVGSTFTDATVTSAAIAANGGIGPNPVHRVQMDFKPSMGDELELRAGSLVRMLHEYDDGWALCIRLDRSQQGVCPRTCLSQRPVKPRPQGPPGSPPQGRPGYAPGPNSRPQSPAGNGPIRPYSPAGSPGMRVQIPSPNARNFSPQSPAQPHSPGVGYVKAQYRPAGESAPKVESVPSTPITSAPSSPITKSSPPPSLRVGPPPQILVSAAPDSRPSSPTGSRPQSPVSAPSPQFAPVKPSPLSNEQRASIVVVEETAVVEQPAANSEQVTFHAM